MSISNSNKQTLSKFIPEASINYAFGLWEQLRFNLHITQNRNSKFGDFRYKEGQRYKITVNGDLNKEAFLVTYIHEVAHLVTFEKHKFSVQPHGIEWKTNFKQLIAPLLIPSIFPQEILVALLNYFKNPKASSCTDVELMKVLHLQNLAPNEKTLSELKIGDYFLFKAIKYQVLEVRRTRILCLQVAAKKNYLIHKMAVVQKTD